MTLGDFHQMVADSMRRGTTLTTQIKNFTALSVQWMERNYTFKYMEVFRLFQAVQGSRTLDLPTNVVIKAHKFIRLVDSTGTYVVLERCEAQDITAIRSSRNDAGAYIPARYWVAGNSTIVFDAVVQGDLEGEALFYQYTDWITGADETHPLLGFASDVLLQQTCFMMAAFLKDSEMAAAYKVLRDEAVNTLVRAEDENKYAGQSFTMGPSA
jgi:hypothetical protein